MKTKNNQVWVISQTEDGCYYCESESREEAIEHGLAEFNGDPFYIGVVEELKPLSSGVYADGIVEQALENLYDWDWNPDYVDFEFPGKGQLKDLQVNLREVFDLWIQKYNLKPSGFAVGKVEYIDPN